MPVAIRLPFWPSSAWRGGWLTSFSNFRTFHVIARSEATWQSPIPYCQALLGVGDGGFDLHFCPEGKNYGIDQCLHWSKQHATGMLHLYGFESTSLAKRKTPSERMVF